MGGVTYFVPIIPADTPTVNLKRKSWFKNGVYDR